MRILLLSLRRVFIEFPMSTSVGWPSILLSIPHRSLRGISDLSRRRLKYQFRRNLRCRPMSAEYQLCKILGVGWSINYMSHGYPLCDFMASKHHVSGYPSENVLISDLSALSDSNGLTDCDVRTRSYIAIRLHYIV
jgi:hypothetical protein